MKAIYILERSLHQVFANFRQALQISLLIFLLGQAASYYYFWDFETLSYDRLLNVVASESWTLAGTTAVKLMSGIWIAVAWHNYILSRDQRWNFIPPLRGAQLLSYGAAACSLVFILLVLFLISILVKSMLAPILGNAADLILVVGFFASVTLVIRLSTVLPSIALGDYRSLGDALRATRGEIGTFLGLALLALICNTIAIYAVDLVAQINPTVGIILRLTSDWFFLLVALSLLNTLHEEYLIRLN